MHPMQAPSRERASTPGQASSPGEAFSRLPVWDFPIRLFHWLLVVSCVAAMVSGKLGGNLIDWHARVGVFILGLVAFRFLWGFVGSPTARFVNFVRGPTAIRSYLRGEWSGIGHNPLGALAVIALLVFLALQGASGVFSNDDIAFQGPLFELVSKALSDRITGMHGMFAYCLQAVVALHVSAIVYYKSVKKLDLVRPMFRGYIQVSAEHQGQGRPRKPGLRNVAAFAVSVAFAVAVAYAASGGLLGDTQAVPSQSIAPSW